MDEVDEHFTIALYMHGWSGWTFHNCSLHACMDEGGYLDFQEG
jgi:hypothetical protein